MPQHRRIGKSLYKEKKYEKTAESERHRLEKDWEHIMIANKNQADELIKQRYASCTESLFKKVEPRIEFDLAEDEQIPPAAENPVHLNLGSETTSVTAHSPSIQNNDTASERSPLLITKKKNRGCWSILFCCCDRNKAKEYKVAEDKLPQANVPTKEEFDPAAVVRELYNL